MSRIRRFTKGNIDKNDYDRVVLTDTGPQETPIIFSNDGFHDNLRQISLDSSEKQNLVKALIGMEYPKRYTIPFRFNIHRTDNSFRQLSLLHPGAQWQIIQFYKSNEDLICYYCSRSNFSIRSPFRVGSSYFYRTSISEQNKFKSGTVDTEDIDRRVRNPSSYFSYKGYNRLYKFFEGNDYMRLEKKYRHMRTMDIIRCFDSIYTHTISWAVKDIDSAKRFTGSMTFGNSFDRLMQQMNYNETNGICIGSETSRIFAEIIMSSVDELVEIDLRNIGIRHKIEYECRRYVDDYYIFSNDPEIIDKVAISLEIHLARFKLFFNSAKLESFERPFQTNKSKIIDETNLVFSNFFEKIFDIERRGNRTLLYPRHIWKSDNLIRWFIKEIKSRCYDSRVGYDMVSNYIISSFANRILSLSESYENYEEDEELPKQEAYVRCTITLLEVIFFFYTVNPTVDASYNVAKSMIIAGNLFKERFEDRLDYLTVCLHRWIIQFVRDTSVLTVSAKIRTTPIEFINVFLAFREFAGSEIFDSQALRNDLFDFDNLDYFSVVSILYYVKDDPEFSDVRDELYTRIEQRLSETKGLAVNSHDCHLLLDIVSCPYFSARQRGRLIKLAIQDLELPKKGMGLPRCSALASEFERRPWFVRWDSINLLNQIVKKELSAVY